ncbi:hypothetical protein O1611_g10545 [Lasiodiplodia mahajangana]|uniref:Uncharacterized protein n=1 Tax=Lasiodiplodia mahajangana TaxID=1108764 RepID=A0ACC2IX38_9PEZI|nr:hypothetical protein O1611_g10545 [Lasiodiplodia mahajangana]
MASASAKPPGPVTALALPEFIMTPRIFELFDSSSLRLKVMGAAWNLVLVTTAAAEHGVFDAMRARSSFVVFLGFTPTIVPDTWNPFGKVNVLGIRLVALARSFQEPLRSLDVMIGLWAQPWAEPRSTSVTME